MVTTSATSRRKAGEGLAVCILNRGVVGMSRGILEVLRVLWKKVKGLLMAGHRYTRN